MWDFEAMLNSIPKLKLLNFGKCQNC